MPKLGMARTDLKVPQFNLGVAQGSDVTKGINWGTARNSPEEDNGLHRRLGKSWSCSRNLLR